MQDSFQICTQSGANAHAKDCKCKCGDKNDMEDTCVKGKWDGKPIENIIVSNMCMYNCWKCRMQDSFQICTQSGANAHAKDCKCKCGDKKDMEDTCVKGKWDG